MKKLIIILILWLLPIYSYAGPGVGGVGLIFAGAPSGCSAPVHNPDFTGTIGDDWPDAVTNAAYNAGNLELTYAAMADALVRLEAVPGEPLTELSVQLAFTVTNGAGTYAASDMSPLMDTDSTSKFAVLMRSAADGAKIEAIRGYYIDDVGVNLITCTIDINEGTTYYLGVYRLYASGADTSDGEYRLWISTLSSDIGVGAGTCSATSIDDGAQTGLVRWELGGTNGDGFYDGANTYVVTIIGGSYKLRSGERCFD
ncbi:hypothetical protein LCGC14_1223970 [marine sediment metagenome]|uniref:Uncharacterized protein n=1 Tax=marine sediment metagenome TaxID=412755 RepID=A0A0F9LAI8_9ZZZZ